MELKPRLKIFNLSLVAIGGLGSLVIGTLAALVPSISAGYPQIIGIVFGAIFICFGYYCLKSVLGFQRVIIRKESIIVKNILGIEKGIILLSEILSYTEIETKTQYSTYHDLILFTANSKLEISSGYYKNYETYKRKLTKGKKQNEFEKRLYHYKQNKYVAFLIGVWGFAFFLLFNGIYLNKQVEIKVNDLTEIEGTVTQIDLEKTGKKNRKKISSVNIKIEEYPTYNFTLIGYAFKASNYSHIISNIQEGDKIQTSILLDQYQKKILKEVPLSFFEKTMSTKSIDMYELKDSDYIYLNFNGYHEQRTKDKSTWGVILFQGLGLMGFLYGFYELVTNKKPVPK